RVVAGSTAASIEFGYPSLDASGQVQRVLLASVALDALAALMQQAQVMPEASVAIVDGQGTIVARSRDPARWNGHRLAAGPLRQLHALLTATTRLAAGDLQARSGLPGGRAEFGQLASTFDAMAAALQQATAALRQQQEARFQALIEHASEVILTVDAAGTIQY